MCCTFVIYQSVSDYYLDKALKSKLVSNHCKSKVTKNLKILSLFQVICKCHKFTATGFQVRKIHMYTTRLLYKTFSNCKGSLWIGYSNQVHIRYFIFLVKTELYKTQPNISARKKEFLMPARASVQGSEIENICHVISGFCDLK